MKDRVSTKVLENGALRYAEYDSAGNFVRYYYLLPADAPTEVGSAINKNNLLPDAVAEALGLLPASDPQVKDALQIISENFFNTAKYWWEKYNAVYEEALGANSTSVDMGTGGTTSLTYYDSITVNPDTGEITLVTSNTMPLTLASGMTTFNGKYVNYNSVVYKCSGNTTYTDMHHYVTGFPVVPSQTAKGAYVKNVSDLSSSAYPSSGAQSGYYYVSLGRPTMPPPQIKIGSYTGTGTYGSSNPNSFVFTDIVPKFMFVAKSGILMIIPCFALTTTYAALGALVEIANQNSSENTWYGVMCKKSADGKTIYWYNTGSATFQLNTNAAVYSTMGIG